MSPNKDYYRILGVLEDAEDIVIKAAYRALAQKYHPDKFQGNAKVAEERMKEINKAYGVLSDATSRKEYDETRVKSEYEEDVSEDTDDLLHTLDKDWADATEYFPDLIEIASSLSIYTKQLEYAFKVLLIEGKDFKNRLSLAKRIKQNYLEKYFGTDKLIHEFAERLFSLRRRDLLAKLNRAVTLLGSNIEAFVIISKLNDDLLPKLKPNSFSTKSEYFIKIIRADAGDLLEHDYSEPHYPIKFLKSLGAHVERAGFFSSNYNVIFDGESKVLSEQGLHDYAISKLKLYFL